MAPCPAAQPQRANVRTFLCRTQAEKETKGAVYNLNAFNGKLLAGVNNKVTGVQIQAALQKHKQQIHPKLKSHILIQKKMTLH
jgi:hypothetical protein